MKKIISPILLSLLLLLAGCSEQMELKERSLGGNEKELAQELNTNIDEREKINSVLETEEELVKWYYTLLNAGDIDAIEDITAPEEIELMQQPLSNIANQLSSNEIKVNFLETIRILSSGDSRTIIFSAEILDKDNKRLQVEINTLNLVQHEEGFKIVFDGSQLIEEQRKAFEDIQQQLNTFVQQDEQMKEHLAWLEEQNRVHQQALQNHMNAHQQFVDQTQQQQMLQQMIPPPSGF